MTAKEGYVWFLPVWLSKNMTNNTCTVNQLKEALAGHFSLGHASFAEPTAVMQENRTVAEWKTAYFSKLCEESDGKKCYNESLLDYGGFAYDAIWVYAIALNRLLEGKKYSIEKLLTPGMTKAFTEIIDEIDFNGVSGRIRFGDGGSRFSTIHVYQWYNESLNIVGSFIPNVSDAANSRYRKLIGGTLELNVSNIRWPDKIIPNDGREVCGVEGLADLLNTSCPNATYILVILLCSITVIIISIASFMFWKHLYDRKLKQSLNKNFIDLLQPLSSQSNTLDKWEVSKDRVVINRRLGEGAFGTVYGGEAQIIDTEWTAVAVKTLKTGSNEEDRVNFLAEAEAMKRFDHKNILKLLGVCLQSEPLFTIMEFMLYGDLKTYLLARRHLVGEKLTEDSDISPKRLTMMALDIARALAYLADMKYVHRDVACRNCLVNTHRIVKLGDFGMTRAMFENDYYKFSRKGMLPVRWMAPESLGMGIFTPASDVWSYGVCIYEIITFGSFPFQGLTNNQVLEHIKNGKILTIPNGVKPPLEALLNGCWSRPNYKKRPSAADIVEYLSGYPRLITPCLDVPLASVQLAETDSDQMELLPGLRKRINGSQQPLNGIIQTVDGYTNPPNGIILSNFKQFQEANIENFNRDTAACNNKTTNSDYNEGSTGNEYNEGGQMNGLTFYNPIEPLLKRDDLYGSNSSMKRYVPMCGIRKNKSFNAQSVDCNGFNNSIL